jgi:4-diphosphocytidyl-2-C-methyl-D-erythritol kinase
MRVRAFAKINLSLRVLRATGDGYHELSTVFQSITLHDTLTFRRVRGPFRIECRDPSCPTDQTNLIWKAADAVWRAAKRDGEPRDLIVRVTKRIPAQAGLGGGSSDAAAAIRACASLWRAKLTRRALGQIASSLGADVPFFLSGGTVRGTGRGTRLSPLRDAPAAWVVLIVPPFGVSTKDAYAWWDGDHVDRRVDGPPTAAGLRNDLQDVVVERQPEIGRIVKELQAAGASGAAMSGSGSAVFGLFDNASRAERALTRHFRGRGLVTTTLNHARYQRLAAPRAS